MADEIERCAVVIDATANEVLALKSSARKSHYDRQSGLQIDYAVRWLRKATERVRAIKPGRSEARPPCDPACFEEALRLLRELRPVVGNARASHWRTTTLARIDSLLRSRGRSPQLAGSDQSPEYPEMPQSRSTEKS